MMRAFFLICVLAAIAFAEPMEYSTKFPSNEIMMYSGVTTQTNNQLLVGAAFKMNKDFAFDNMMASITGNVKVVAEDSFTGDVYIVKDLGTMTAYQSYKDGNENDFFDVTEVANSYANTQTYVYHPESGNLEKLGFYSSGIAGFVFHSEYIVIYGDFSSMTVMRTWEGTDDFDTFNVAIYSRATGEFVALENKGLNAKVNSAVITGNTVILGGEFNSLEYYLSVDDLDYHTLRDASYNSEHPGCVAFLDLYESSGCRQCIIDAQAEFLASDQCVHAEEAVCSTQDAVAEDCDLPTEFSSCDGVCDVDYPDLVDSCSNTFTEKRNLFEEYNNRRIFIEVPQEEINSTTGSDYVWGDCSVSRPIYNGLATLDLNSMTFGYVPGYGVRAKNTNGVGYTESTYCGSSDQEYRFVPTRNCVNTPDIAEISTQCGFTVEYGVRKYSSDVMGYAYSSSLTQVSSGTVDLLAISEDGSSVYIAGDFVGPYTKDVGNSYDKWCVPTDIPDDIDFTGVAVMTLSGEVPSEPKALQHAGKDSGLMAMTTTTRYSCSDDSFYPMAYSQNYGATVEQLVTIGNVAYMTGSFNSLYDLTTYAAEDAFLIDEKTTTCSDSEDTVQPSSGTSISSGYPYYDSDPAHATVDNNCEISTVPVDDTCACAGYDSREFDAEPEYMRHAYSSMEGVVKYDGSNFESLGSSLSTMRLGAVNGQLLISAGSVFPFSYMLDAAFKRPAFGDIVSTNGFFGAEDSQLYYVADMFRIDANTGEVITSYGLLDSTTEMHFSTGENDTYIYGDWSSMTGVTEPYATGLEMYDLESGSTHYLPGGFATMHTIGDFNRDTAVLVVSILKSSKGAIYVGGEFTRRTLSFNSYDESKSDSEQDFSVGFELTQNFGKLVKEEDGNYTLSATAGALDGVVSDMIFLDSLKDSDDPIVLLAGAFAGYVSGDTNATAEYVPLGHLAYYYPNNNTYEAVGGGVNDDVYSVVWHESSNTIYFASGLMNADGVSAEYLMSFNRKTGEFARVGVFTISTNVNAVGMSVVNGLVLEGNTLAVFGTFDEVNGVRSAGIIKYEIKKERFVPIEFDTCMTGNDDCPVGYSNGFVTAMTFAGSDDRMVIAVDNDIMIFDDGMMLDNGFSEMMASYLTINKVMKMSYHEESDGVFLLGQFELDTEPKDCAVMYMGMDDMRPVCVLNGYADSGDMVFFAAASFVAPVTMLIIALLALML